MSVYVCADAKLGNKDLLKQQEGFIEKWNKLVKPEDVVLIMGEFSCGTEEETKDIISQLTGTLEIIDYQENAPYNNFSEENWKKMGIKRVWCVGGIVTGYICGGDKYAVIAATDRNLHTTGVTYYAAPGSLTNSKKRFENNILNLSMEFWNYTPILYQDIPRLIDDALLFESMENEEVNLNEK